MKKCCFKCGESKPLEEFYEHSKMADGHLNKCKECTKKDSNKHRADNLESCRAYDRQRSSLPHRVNLRQKVTKTWIKDGRHTAAVGRYRKRYPNEYKAHNAVSNGIRDGKLKRGAACTRCGKRTRKLHGHHNDYLKKLDVEWLCLECHGKKHQIYPRSENVEISVST